MNFIEAVGDWKSNDEWRYADKEAAWKFFFAAGKESSQAVISAQCVKMSQYESIIFELRKQLAAEQLNNKLLREALEAVIKVHGYESGIPVEALSLPASTEALDAYVAKRLHDMACDKGLLRIQVEELTRQRDLAVEALEKIAAPVRVDGTYNRCREACEILARETLSAIKESDGK